MRRIPLLLAAAIAVLLSASLPANAILWGSPDGDRHPYVAMVALYEGIGPDAYAGRCTGTLLAPTIVLTAGHCTYAIDHARVYFSSSVDVEQYANDVGGVRGMPHADPDYVPAAWPGPPERWAWVEDVGVVLLDSPVTMPTYGVLAPKGTVDDLAARTGSPAKLELVGYGSQDETPRPVRSPVRYGATVWMRGQQSVLNRSYYVQVSSTARSGGFCFGDSGGPVLLPDTNQIVAVNSYVESIVCTGNGWSYRVDTDRGYDFVEPWID